MSVIALIPARGGSKAIPRKNIVQLAGKPLIAYSIEAALNAKLVDKVIVSTDDEEIAEVAKQYGADVPYLRPKEIASDVTPMIDVLKHTVEWHHTKDKKLDGIVLLQPTSPLRTSIHIDEAIQLFLEKKPTSVVSVTKVPHQFNPISVLSMENGFIKPYLKDQISITRRQDKPVVYGRNGPAILVSSIETLASGELYGTHSLPYVMSIMDSFDIDEPDDLDIVEWLLLRRKNA